jgi:hypothetical protein
MESGQLTLPMQKPLTRRLTRDSPSIISMTPMPMTIIPLMHLIANPNPTLRRSILLWPKMVALRFPSLVALMLVKLLSLLGRLPLCSILRLNVRVMRNRLIVHSTRPTSSPLPISCETLNSLTGHFRLKLISFMIAFTRLSISVTALTFNSISKGGWQEQLCLLLDGHPGLISIIQTLNMFVAKSDPPSIILKVVLIPHGPLMGLVLLTSMMTRKTGNAHLPSISQQLSPPPLRITLHLDLKPLGKYEW